MAAAAATSAPERWALDIARTQQGEWWRLISGHLVHLNWQHYWCDLLTLGLVLLLCCRLEKRLSNVALTALLSAAAVSLALMVTRPVDVYGGLSGISTGLLSCAALRLISLEARIRGAVLLGAILFKICLEQQGMSISGVPPVWQAHCAGAVAGVLIFAQSVMNTGLP